MRIMNLWPEWPWSARRKAATNGGIAASLREGEGMGVWQDIMGKWQPRARNPYLLEALREAIPILDGGISRLTTPASDGKRGSPVATWWPSSPRRADLEKRHGENFPISCRTTRESARAAVDGITWFRKPEPCLCARRRKPSSPRSR